MTAAAVNVIVSQLVVHHNSTDVVSNLWVNGFSNITPQRFEYSISFGIVRDIRGTGFSRVSIALEPLGKRILYVIELYNIIFDRCIYHSFRNI